MSEKVERGKVRERINTMRIVPRRDELNHPLSNGAAYNKRHAPPTTFENFEPQLQQNLYSNMIGNDYIMCPTPQVPIHITPSNSLFRLQGFTTTVLAYGSTGSGKTHTISGTEESPGILPRSVDLLFQRLESDAAAGSDKAFMVFLT